MIGNLLLKLFAWIKGLDIAAPASRPEIHLLPRAAPDDTVQEPQSRDISILKRHLAQNKFSRPGEPLKHPPAGIVIHWVENPGATAAGIRNYFNNLKGRYASTQYVVGLRGEILQMIPEDEVAWHVPTYRYRRYKNGLSAVFPEGANYGSIGIECCHPDWSGKMNDATLATLESLCVQILRRYNLSADDLYLHFHFTGKKCHRWFANNPAQWEAFKARIGARL